MKKASTLIISSVLETRLNNFDYNVILLKRSKNMRAWPGVHVFPGGKIDNLDKSTKWLNVFFDSDRSLEIKNDPSLLRSYFRGIITNNSIGTFHFNQNSTAKFELPSEISYRLCAIRETFEETGLLLAYEKDNLNSRKKFDNPHQFVDLYDKNQTALRNWKKRICNNPDEFIDMFLDLKLVPDIISLHEWSNWITPSFQKIRFDTLFFTCFLKRFPDKKLIQLNRDEIDSLDALTPEETLNNKDLRFIPPQLYEFNRMLKFKDFERFSLYSQYRQKNGLKPWLPKHCSDLKLGVLPGDYMYDEIDEEDERSSDQFINYAEVNSGLKLNRIVRKDNRTVIQSNLELEDISDSKL